MQVDCCLWEKDLCLQRDTKTRKGEDENGKEEKEKKEKKRKEKKKDRKEGKDGKGTAAK